MEKYDIDPSVPNIIDSIKHNDTGRNNSLYYFLKLLNTQKGSWSVAIDGKWGAGKSFFLRQCKWLADLPKDTSNISKDSLLALKSFLNETSSYDDIKKVPIKTVYYDAWVNDSSKDPLTSLLRSLITANNWTAASKEALIKAVDITSHLITSFTNVNTDSLLQLIKDNQKSNQESLSQQLKEQLTNLTPNNGRLIIFIDELDRCKPTFAVNLLEKIKHFFQAPNVTFVFAVDLSQLQNTIKRYYGTNFDGLQYLDRFFDIVIPLPKADIERYFDNTEGILQVDNLFEGFEEKKNNWYHRFCKELILHFGFSIRQINHFYLRANSSAYNYLDQRVHSRGIDLREENGQFIIYAFLLPLMVALSMADIDEYRKFINGAANENTLKVLEESDSFNQCCDINIESEEGRQKSKSAVEDIYFNIFNDAKNPEVVSVNNNCIIEFPKRYKNLLIDACSLLSPNISYGIGQPRTEKGSNKEY